MKRVLLILILIAAIQPLDSQTLWTNVKEHGADPTGIKSCTVVINRLIDSLAGHGGGTLFFPGGTFLTGPIIMKSNITLYIDAGSTIKFSNDFDEYLPMVPSRWEEVRVINFKSQIYAYRCENISIRGDGHLDGQGTKWWDLMRKVASDPKVNTKWQEIFKKENELLLSKNEYLRSKNNFLRPPMITTYECKNVLIEGISLSNPPFWTIMPAFTDNITITGITIENPWNAPNTDGIDPSSCSNVHISNCQISVGDDCIVIKSGRDEDGREAAKPTENVTITNCTMLNGHGGVVIGSEMSGGVRGITISNCVFQGTEIGVRIKSMRGRGGIVEDVRISNLIMNNIKNEGILITLRYQPSAPEPVSVRTPAVKNIFLSGIIIRNASRPLAIYGLEERDVSLVSFSDMQILSRRGILIENSSDIGFRDIRMEISEGIPLEAKDSKKISWDHVSVITPVLNTPYLKFTNCQDVRVTGCYQPETIPVFIEEDAKSELFFVLDNIFPGTSTLFQNNGKYLKAYNNILKNRYPND